MKYSITRFSLVLFFVFTTLELYAQSFQRFLNKDGFNQNTVNAIEEGYHGYLWLGTPNGLFKYDGYEFINLSNDIAKNLGSNNIKSLHKDENNFMWLGTAKGLSVYIPSLQKCFKIPLGNLDEISCIKTGPNGRVWVSINNRLFVCEVIDSVKEIVTVSEIYISEKHAVPKINDFTFTDKNQIVIGSIRGLYTFNYSENSSEISALSIMSFPDFMRQNISVVKQVGSQFWVGTLDGLFKSSIEGNKIHIISHYKSIAKKANGPSRIKFIMKDAKGLIWISSANHGLSTYKPTTDSFHNFAFNPKKSKGLSSNFINTIFQDKFDVLWIGTGHGGLNKLDLNQKEFINYAHNPYDSSSVSGDLVNSILEDKRGKLWVTNFSAPLCRTIETVSDKNVRNLHFENLQGKLPISTNDKVISAFEDSKGFIWFGTWYSIVVYNPNKDTFKKINLTYKGKPIKQNLNRSISSIDDKTILVCGRGISILQNPWSEIGKSKKPKVELLFHNDLKSAKINTVLKDKNNNFWIGTEIGLLKAVFDGEKLTLDKVYISGTNGSLNPFNSNVFSILQLDQNDLWIGTFGDGLYKLQIDRKGNIEKQISFKTSNLLKNDAIFDLLPQGDTYLWISTDKGLCKMNTKSLELKNYDVRDGLAYNNFRRSTGFFGESGFFYFGGYKGVTIFDPNEIKPNTIEPQVSITNLSIDNNIVKAGQKLKGEVILEVAIQETDKIILRQEQKNISLELSVHHNGTPSKNRLMYQLEGFDEKWVERSIGKTKVSYSSLPAGNYLFKVKGANSDGLWSKHSKNLKVIVLPPWYKTWWSYMLFGIGLVLIIIRVSKYFVELEKLKQNLVYEKLDKKRVDEINQGKFDFFMNISHEFRTPLTLISGPLERVSLLNPSNEIKKYLSVIENNTKRMLNLVDQLINFKQVEGGHMKLSYTKTNLGDLIYPAAEAFDSFSVQKNINFLYKVKMPNQDIVIDIEKVERIIFNLLSNSFKFTKASGTIQIDAKIADGNFEKQLEIDIIDTGTGIKPKKIDQIFQRFYQVESGENNIGGAGIGLAYCKSLIDLMGGTITVTSEPNIETRFAIHIPCENKNSVKSELPAKSIIKNWVALKPEISDVKGDDKLHSDGKKPTLLIVEDEDDIREFLSDSFKDKYTIILAKNGNIAIEKVNTHQPNLIISDVMMPAMDGFELCEKIKSDASTCHIPLILLTALEHHDKMIKGLELGADDYISKPFSLKHLQTKIEKLLENKTRLKAYFSSNSVLPEKGIELNNRDKYFLKKIIVIIEENISNSSFGVEELSIQMGLSSSQFYRKLKRLTSQVPSTYLRNFRLQRAAELLSSNEGFNVTEVMYQIGIDSSSYFSSSFKKLHGVTPSNYIPKK